MPKKKKEVVHFNYHVQTLISRVFDPPIIIGLLTVLAVSLSDLSRRGMVFFTFLLPFLFGLPLAFFVWKLKTHQVSNWDVTKRKERIIPLLAFLGFLLIDIVAVSVLDNPFLLNIFVLYFLWMLGFFLITLVFKISGHTGIATLGAGLLFNWFGWIALPAFFIVLLVAWARVSRGDHTFIQAVVGILYSLILLEVWYLVLPH